MKKMIFRSLLAIAALTMTIVACQKDSAADNEVIPAGKAKLSLYLTDDPSLVFDSIFIDIQMVEVKVNRTNGGEFWDTLQIRRGVYNILNFRNGIDTLLSSSYIANGEIKKLRLTLGTNNSVVKNRVTYPLSIHNNERQIIIDIPDVDRISQNSFRIWIDFDGHGSIIKLRNNQFELKAKIKAFNHNRSGRVEGRIQPSAALPAIVSVISGNDTLLALTENDGKFKVRGILASTVRVYINPSNGYRDTTINNVRITPGDDTELGNIRLRQ
jgi:hypothetical protein